MATAEQLTKVDLFKSLSHEALEEIAASMKTLTIPSSKLIVKTGDVAREMFFVLSGQVRILDTSGKEIRVLQPGMFFGELGLIYNIPRTVSVVAVDEVHLCVLQKADFDSLRDRHPDIALAIDALAKDRFAHFQSNLLRLAPGTVAVERLSSYTDEQLNSFRQIFYAHSEGKGHINIEQLSGLLNKVIGTGYQVSAAEAKEFMKKMDKDGDGAIDFEEFVGGLKYLSWIAGGPDAASKKMSPYLYGAAAIGVVVVGVLAYVGFTKSRK